MGKQLGRPRTIQVDRLKKIGWALMASDPFVANHYRLVLDEFLITINVNDFAWRVSVGAWEDVFSWGVSIAEGKPTISAEAAAAAAFASIKTWLNEKRAIVNQGLRLALPTSEDTNADH